METDGRGKLLVLGLSGAIAKSLDSLDVSERLLTLDHWEAQGAKAALDPMFVALDDKDEVLQRKIIEIIERYEATDMETEVN